MRKSAPIEVVVHYPKTKEGWDELGKRVATAHANYVIEKIDRLNCPTWQKLELLQAVIDTTKMCIRDRFTIDKKLQKGAMTGIVYKNAPQNVFHSWVEVYFEDRWYELEAFILDKKYLRCV